jgi:hypothetical protein
MKPKPPGPRVWFALVKRIRGSTEDGLITRSFHTEDEATLYLQQLGYDLSGTREIIDVVELAAFQKLEAELREAKAELARVTEVCKDLNRERNTTFNQSCKNRNERDQALSMCEQLSRALNPFAETYRIGQAIHIPESDWDYGDEKAAHEALSSYAAFKARGEE